MQTIRSQGNNMNKNLAYIIGVFIGDGSVLQNKMFNLQSIDKDFVDITAMCLENLSKNKVTVTVLNRLTSSNRLVYSVYLCDVKFCRLLREITNNKKNLPIDFERWDRILQLELIAGLLDSEGYVAMSKFHIYNGRKVFDMRIGIGATDIWLYELHRFCRKNGFDVGKITREKIKSGKIFAKFGFNKKSFIENGLYFKIFRKQQRIENYKILFPGSTTIRGIPNTNYTKRLKSKFAKNRKRDSNGRFVWVMR